MFKVSYNRANLGIEITTTSPLSIRAGEAGLDPTSSDMACVRTQHYRYGRTVYIPGSSLKGVIRSTAESLIRGRSFQCSVSASQVLGACDPARMKLECARDEKNEKAPQIHCRTCLACRLFGSLAMRGRCTPRDLFPFDDSANPSSNPTANLNAANCVEVRYGVLIGRLSGAVEVGPFDQEMVPAGVSFYGEIALQNYQSWQLGLLWMTLNELTDGFAQLGSGKSRGLGAVKVLVRSLVHEQRLGKTNDPVGIGSLVDDTTRAAYGLFPESSLPKVEGKPLGLSLRFTATDASSINSWKAAALNALGQLHNYSVERERHAAVK